MAHKVFICHSSKDKAVADAACAALESHRIPCWIAPRDISPSAEWGAAIVDAITECQIVLLIFSAHANASPDVRREINLSISEQKDLLPFRIENVNPTGAIKYAVSNRHWLDAVDPPLERRLLELRDKVARLLNMPSESGPLWQPPHYKGEEESRRQQEERHAQELAAQQARAAEEQRIRLETEQEARDLAQAQARAQAHQKAEAEARAKQIAEQNAREALAQQAKEREEREARLAQEKRLSDLAEQKASAEAKEREEQLAAQKAREAELQRLEAQRRKEAAERQAREEEARKLREAQRRFEQQQAVQSPTPASFGQQQPINTEPAVFWTGPKAIAAGLTSGGIILVIIFALTSQGTTQPVPTPETQNPTQSSSPPVAIAQPPQPTVYDQAQAAYAAKDYASSVGLFDTACQSGTPEACVDLANIYRAGTVVAPNMSKAKALFQQACKSGDESGCTQLHTLEAALNALNAQGPTPTNDRAAREAAARKALEQ
jgi:TPR repeat protein